MFLKYSHSLKNTLTPSWKYNYTVLEIHLHCPGNTLTQSWKNTYRLMEIHFTILEINYITVLEIHLHCPGNTHYIVLEIHPTLSWKYTLHSP
jgi:hypothetical protein